MTVGTFDLVMLAGGAVLHVEDDRGQVASVTVCGTTGAAARREDGVDDRAVQVGGIRVCAKCLTRYNDTERSTTMSDTTTEATDVQDETLDDVAAGEALDAAIEEQTDSHPAEEKPKRSRAKTTPKAIGDHMRKIAAKPDPKPSAKAKPAAKQRDRAPADAATNAETVGAKDLKALLARAEKAIASQPKRTAAELDDAAKQQAFRLGKAIAADAWLLRKATASTPRQTVLTMVERIERRVAERNAVRLPG